MTDPKSFLVRWSRRKHAAGGADETTSSINEIQSSTAAPTANFGRAVQSERSAGPPSEDRAGAELSSVASDPVDQPFDPLSVPPIESITADTDIRGFLAPGVPPDLTRAALRRAWAADPTIRDFVGLADYDWDFNTPGSMAGFGSLEMTDDARRAAAQFIGMVPGPSDPDRGEPDQVPDPIAQAVPVRHQVDDRDHGTNAPVLPSSREANNLSQGDQRSGSPSCAAQTPENSQLVVRRSQGGALPK
jgi:hypothetical protein